MTSGRQTRRARAAPKDPDALWRAVGDTFVAADFWCHTHGRWVNVNAECSDACERVPVFMAAPGKARPNRRDGSDWEAPADGAE